jgi:hypothetical protein
MNLLKIKNTDEKLFEFDRSSEAITAKSMIFAASGKSMMFFLMTFAETMKSVAFITAKSSPMLIATAFATTITIK